MNIDVCCCQLLVFFRDRHKKRKLNNWRNSHVVFGELINGNMFLHFFSLREQIKMHHFNDQTDELWAPPVASTKPGCSVRPKAPLSWQPRQRGVVLRDEGIKHLTRREHLVAFSKTWNM